MKAAIIRWAHRLLAKWEGVDNSPVKVKFRQDVLQLQTAMEGMRRSVTDRDINEDFPLEHFFVPMDEQFGCYAYARKIFLPKGSRVIGKIHKHQHLNFIMQGRVSVNTEFGPQYFTAPYIFVSEAGLKRAVQAEEDTIWVTVHLTDLCGEENVDAIVDRLTVETYAELGMIDSMRGLVTNGESR